MPPSAVACKKCDMVNQRLKAPEPKTKLRRGKQGGSARQGKTKKKPAQAVRKGVAIAVAEPKMEIGAKAAAEVNADERLRPCFCPGGATGDSSRHGGAAGAFPGCSVVKQ